MLCFWVWSPGANADGWGAFSNELLELSSCEGADKNPSKRWGEPRPVLLQKRVSVVLAPARSQPCAREVGAGAEEILIPYRSPSRVIRGAGGEGGLDSLPSAAASSGSPKELVASATVGNFPSYLRFYKAP